MPPSLDQQVAFLARVPLMHDINASMLRVLAGVMTLARCDAGKVVCRQGDPGDSLFIIAAGKMEVLVGATGRERCVATLGTGHVVGEVALVDGEKRSATVRAATPSLVFVLRRSEFDQLLHSGNVASMQLLNNVARDLATRVRHVSTHYAEVFAKTAQSAAQLAQALGKVRAEAEVGEDTDSVVQALDEASP